MQQLPQPRQSLRPAIPESHESLNCPHCKQGGQDLGRYVSVAIRWDDENGHWHCLICGFVGFGSDYGMLRHPIVACVGPVPRLPGEPRKKKKKSLW